MEYSEEFGHSIVNFTSVVNNDTNADNYFNATKSEGGSKINPFSAERLYYAAEVLDYYYTPLLCFVGAMGNCLSVAVFCFNANQRSLSSSYYLSALAMSDTGFLITLFALWLDSLGAGVLSSNFGCSFVMFSGQVTCFLSVWLTVAFTVERFFAVCSPLLRSSICTVSKAKKVIFGLTAFALVAFSYTFFIAQVVDRNRLGSEDEQSYDYSESDHIPNPTLLSTITTTTEETSRNEEGNLMLFHSTYISKLFNMSNSSFNECRGATNDTVFGKSCQLVFDRVRDNDQFIPSQFQLLRHSRTSSPVDITNTFNLDPNQYSLRGNITDLLGTSTTNAPTMFNSWDEDQSQNESNNVTPRTVYICTVPIEYSHISMLANYMDTICTLIIPFCLITYFNMRIAVCIWKLKDERKKIFAVRKSSNNRGNKNQSRWTTKHFGKVLRHVQSANDGDDDDHENPDLRIQTKSRSQERSPATVSDDRSAKSEDGFANSRQRTKNPTINSTVCSPTLHTHIKPESSDYPMDPSDSDNKESQSRMYFQDEVNFTGKYSLLEPQEQVSSASTLPQRSTSHAEGTCDLIYCNPSTSTHWTQMKQEKAPSNLKIKSKSKEKLKTKPCNSINETVSSESGNFLKQVNEVETQGKLSSPKSTHQLHSTTTLNDISSRVDMVNRQKGNSKSFGGATSHSSETRVTKMLLLVSSTFLILNLPSHAIRCLSFMQTFLWDYDLEVQQRLNAAQQLSNILLFNSNFAVNFLLYCLSGRNFRKSLWNIIFGQCMKKSKSSRHWRSGHSTATLRENIRMGSRNDHANVNARITTSKLLIHDITTQNDKYQSNKRNNEVTTRNLTIGDYDEIIELDTIASR